MDGDKKAAVSEEFCLTILTQQMRLFEMVIRQYQERLDRLERDAVDLREMLEVRHGSTER